MNSANYLLLCLTAAGSDQNIGSSCKDSKIVINKRMATI